MTAEAVGDIEVEDKVLVIKRIAVTYRLVVDDAVDRDALDRAFQSHPRHCPVYRSIHPQIEVSTALELNVG